MSYNNKEKFLIKEFHDTNPPSAPDWSELLASEFGINGKNENFTKESVYKRLISESLNQSDRKEQYNIYKQLLRSSRSEKHIDESINNITNVLIDNGYFPIGQGSFRKVYSKNDINFVIKVAKSKQGVESNSKEIAASHPSTKSYEVKNIIPELYEHDRRYDPLWVICEKVKPLKSSRYEEIIKVFPTFFKAHEKTYWFNKINVNDKKRMLIDVIEGTYLYMVKNNVYDKSIILEEIFKYFNTPDSEKQKIKNEESLLDIDHFIKSTSYDYTSDLYLRNLAIRNSGNPSPKDFVILDFDTQFQRKKPKSSSKNKNLPFIDFWSSYGEDFSDVGEDESDFSDFSSGSNNESIIEKVYLCILNESYGGSHPDETYKYGWPEFDETWLDKKGLTTWDEDRKTVKKYLKKMGMI